MNFQLTEEQILIQKTSREFADTELAPGVVDRDDKKIWPKEGIKKMAELGFMGIWHTDFCSCLHRSHHQILQRSEGCEVSRRAVNQYRRLQNKRKRKLM